MWLLPLVALAPAALAAVILGVSAPGNVGVAPENKQVEQLIRAATTTSGDLLEVPDGPLELLVSKYHIGSRAALPVHKHPYPRFGYVLSGSLMVTNSESHHAKVFNAGQVIVEDVDRWHEARNLQAQPVELLVIDLVKPGAGNLILRQ